MKSVRTVVLEILRGGEAHNQLLSPLTSYLGMCGNHPAAPIQVPFEHEQLRQRLRDLDYRRDEEGRQFQLNDLARVLGTLLSGMPGLINQLTETSRDRSLTHLRLVLSASELALLPLELASAPGGLPGAGRSLSLLADLPLCITREVRRVGNIPCRWPDRPRILFVAASPPGVGPIPRDAHLLALRQVIDPWVAFADVPRQSAPDAKGAPRTHRDDYLVILPQATPRAIQEVCQEREFTHVHILAHGVELAGPMGGSYGLALHGDGAEARRDVSGPDLAQLILSSRSVRPTVVTLAICDGGHVGPIERAGGASIAYELHAEGIPLVVASQFPLSHAASVLLTQILYDGLLKGDDPRVLLHDLRRQLRARVLGTHDWASLVAYASFPSDLGEQLADVRYTQARTAIEAALQLDDRVNEVTWNALDPDRAPTRPRASDAEREKGLRQARKKMADAENRLNELLVEELQAPPRRLARLHGLVASTKKRFAESLYREYLLDKHLGSVEELNEEKRANLEQYLIDARSSYWEAFQVDRSSSWALVQYLSLDVVIRGPEALRNQSYWLTAKVLASADLSLKDEQRRTWAYGSLIELYLLAQLLPNELGMPPRGAAHYQDEALRLAKNLLEATGANSIELYSARRQIERYRLWFNKYQPQLDPLAEPAKAIVRELPLSSQFI